jgi:hypothetical protein
MPNIYTKTSENPFKIQIIIDYIIFILHSYIQLFRNTIIPIINFKKNTFYKLLLIDWLHDYFKISRLNCCNSCDWPVNIAALLTSFYSGYFQSRF